MLAEGRQGEILLGLGLAGAVSGGARVSQAGEASAERAESMRIVGDLFIRAVNGMVGLTTIDQGRRLAHAEGKRDSFQLVVEQPSR